MKRNENEFWSIIERAIKVSENDPDEIAFTAYEDKTEKEMPDTEVIGSENPRGEEWSEDSEDDLRRICPNLFEKYNV